MAIDPRWAWEPYRPSNDAPWTRARAGHLLRRAGFGATKAELDTALAAGPERTVERLLAGGLDGPAFPEPIRRSNNGAQMTAWWLKRILETQHPLREKLTLFWHNHFATSNAKLNSTRMMTGQYDLLHKHALGSFKELLHDMGRDPAMLVWLDTVQSRKGMPNENYARELMELFSLGIGNYTEADIREAAKAFTGWGLGGESGSYFNPREHDGGPKTVFGETGNFTADDIANLCLSREACPRFIASKLVRFLISDTLDLTPELIAPLAAQFREAGFQFAPLVETVLRSNLFFAPQSYRAKVKSPVTFAVGIVRALEGNAPPAPLAASLDGLGQKLFYPPSVKGWDGGPAWLNGQTLLYRQNLALALTSTEDDRFKSRCDPAVLLSKHGVSDDAGQVRFLLDLLLDGEVSDGVRERLLHYRQEHAKTPAFWTAEDRKNARVRSLCYLVLALPEFQLE